MPGILFSTKWSSRFKMLVGWLVGWSSFQVTENDSNDFSDFLHGVGIDKLSGITEPDF